MIPIWVTVILIILAATFAGRMSYIIGYEKCQEKWEKRANTPTPKAIECVHLWSKWEKITLKSADSTKHDGLQRACDSCGDVQRKYLEAKEIESPRVRIKHSYEPRRW